MKKTNILVTTIVFVMSFLVSLFVLYTPIPSASLDGFSAVNAATFIAEISKEPHAVSDEVAHERVRLYLKDQLEGFVGASNVVEMNYDKALVDPDCEYDVKNLLATIPGQSPIGMLLVAHYDSRGHIGRSGELGRSYGASDDGYGVATLLEIARLFGNRTLKNSLYILLTDAEETGLYGAYMAAQEPFMANIGFVINVESRVWMVPFICLKLQPKMIELLIYTNVLNYQLLIVLPPQFIQSCRTSLILLRLSKREFQA